MGLKPNAGSRLDDRFPVIMLCVSGGGRGEREKKQKTNARTHHVFINNLIDFENVCMRTNITGY